jgi:L-lysine 6-transaminase
MTIIKPTSVHDVLARYMQIGGYDIVLDLEKCKGSYCYDARENREYLDFFSMFASAPVGHNHPKIFEPEFLKKLQRAAINNVTNSDFYTVEMAEFVSEFFKKVVIEKHFKYAFFVAGGALGVENAIKAAMDWKVRKNFEKGYKEEKGHKILHFKEAFHGRTGYTISLTNTADPRKYKYFAKYDWPRVTNPTIRFPMESDNLKKLLETEEKAKQEIIDAFNKNKDDIAAIIIEPIQGEGGDNHFRGEFLKWLQDFCRNNEALFILDEVQTGLGMTGLWWAYEHFDLEPDCVAFGKKTQVCGFLCGPRIDEVKDNVFHEGSRLNSTWGGNLVDMVRAQKYIEIIEEENLIENSAELGKYLLKHMENLQKEFPQLLTNSRGRGLMCAFDFPTTELREDFRNRAYKHGLIILGSGLNSVRFRPALNIKKEELDKGLDIIETSLKEME